MYYFRINLGYTTQRSKQTSNPIINPYVFLRKKPMKTLLFYIHKQHKKPALSIGTFSTNIFRKIKILSSIIQKKKKQQQCFLFSYKKRTYGRKDPPTNVRTIQYFGDVRIVRASFYLVHERWCLIPLRKENAWPQQMAEASVALSIHSPYFTLWLHNSDLAGSIRFLNNLDVFYLFLSRDTFF